jgi:hypothetical protein
VSNCKHEAFVCDVMVNRSARDVRAVRDALPLPRSTGRHRPQQPDCIGRCDRGPVTHRTKGRSRERDGRHADWLHHPQTSERMKRSDGGRGSKVSAGPLYTACQVTRFFRRYSDLFGEMPGRCDGNGLEAFNVWFLREAAEGERSRPTAALLLEHMPQLGRLSPEGCISEGCRQRVPRLWCDLPLRLRSAPVLLEGMQAVHPEREAKRLAPPFQAG